VYTGQHWHSPADDPGLDAIPNLGMEMTECLYPAMVAWDGTVVKLGTVFWKWQGLVITIVYYIEWLYLGA